MKNKILVIVLIILVIFWVSIVAKYIDSARVRNGIEPKLTIKIVSYDGSKVT